MNKDRKFRLLFFKKEGRLCLEFDVKSNDEWHVHRYLTTSDPDNIKRYVRKLEKQEFHAVTTCLENNYQAVRTSNYDVYFLDHEQLKKETLLAALFEKMAFKKKSNRVKIMKKAAPQLIAAAMALVVTMNIVNVLSSNSHEETDILSVINTFEQIANNDEETPLVETNYIYSEPNYLLDAADMYQIPYEEAASIVSNNRHLYSDSSDKLAGYQILSDYYWNNPELDQKPIKSDTSVAENYELISQYAALYGVDNFEHIENLYKIHMLETGNEQFSRFTEDNNFGGVKHDNEFLTYKTRKMGAESFVRSYLNIVNTVTRAPNYQSSGNLLYDIAYIYCPDAAPFKYDDNGQKVMLPAPEGGYWHERVEGIKMFESEPVARLS